MTVASETTARTTLSSSEDRKKFHRTDAFDHIDYHIPEKFTSCSSARKRGISFFLNTRVLLMTHSSEIPFSYQMLTMLLFS